jgi:hypothetical protein
MEPPRNHSASFRAKSGIPSAVGDSGKLCGHAHVYKDRSEKCRSPMRVAL